MKIQKFSLFILFISFNIYAQDSCSELTQDECTESELCEWTVITTPNGVFEICIDSENMDDGGWNDDGGNEDDGGDFEGCAELTQDECIENPECEWGEMITPNGFFEVCFESGWNDGGDDDEEDGEEEVDEGNMAMKKILKKNVMKKNTMKKNMMMWKMMKKNAMNNKIM